VVKCEQQEWWKKNSDYNRNSERDNTQYEGDVKVCNLENMNWKFSRNEDKN